MRVVFVGQIHESQFISIFLIQSHLFTASVLLPQQNIECTSKHNDNAVAIRICQ